MPISDLQFQYQAKNQLLSVDLSLLQAFTQCLASAFKIMPLLYSTSAINVLFEAESFLATFNKQYAAPLEQLGRNASFASLDEADRLLAIALGVTYHHRVQLFEALRELMQTAITVLADSSDFSPRISTMEETLSALDLEIDNLIQQINFAGGVAAVTEAAFAQHLHLFTENFTTFYQELAHLSANSTLVQNEELVSNYRYLIRTTTAIKQLVARLFVGNHFALLELSPENLLRFLRQIIKPSFLLPLLKLSRENFENYENQLAHQEEKKLQAFLGARYPEALRKIKQIVLLKEWLA